MVHFVCKVLETQYGGTSHEEKAPIGKTMTALGGT